MIAGSPYTVADEEKIMFFTLCFLITSTSVKAVSYTHLDVYKRQDRQRMAYNLISKILCIFLMQAETVIFFVSVPLFQFCLLYTSRCV